MQGVAYGSVRAYAGARDHEITFMEELGGVNAPALGWAMGVDCVILSLADEQPPLVQRKRFFIATIGEGLITKTLELRNTIQGNDHVCIMGNPKDSIKRQLKKANRLQVDYTILYGEDEAKAKVCSVKDMESGEQKQITLKDFASFIKSI